MQANKFAIVLSLIDKDESPFIFVTVLVELHDFTANILRQFSLYTVNFNLLFGVQRILLHCRTQKLHITIAEQNAYDELIVGCWFRSKNLLYISFEFQMMIVEFFQENVVEREYMSMCDEYIGF